MFTGWYHLAGQSYHDPQPALLWLSGSGSWDYPGAAFASLEQVKCFFFFFFRFRDSVWRPLKKAQKQVETANRNKANTSVNT